MTAGDDLDLEVPQPALLFDLDGTLVDSVYQHVIAWQEALTECGIPLSVWRIHRRIGMSGGLVHRRAAARDRCRAGRRHVAAAAHPACRGLPPSARVRRAAARRPRAARPPARPGCPVRDRDQRCAAHRGLGAGRCSACPTTCRSSPATSSSGPSRTRTCSSPRPGGSASTRRTASSSATACGTCSPRSAPGALGIGLLSGGYGREELERSGAYRVYADPAEMLTRLEEVGVRP